LQLLNDEDDFVSDLVLAARVPGGVLQKDIHFGLDPPADFAERGGVTPKGLRHKLVLGVDGELEN